ncbi:MAG: glycosyltransferase [Desulfobacterota bacterium]|nr:glycosyltransferase [Thermodesulfobacteriota bacterium]
MARFLFTVVPAIGHINPTLPIAVELQRRGHEVAYATGADMQQYIHEQGCAAFTAGLPSFNNYTSFALRRMFQFQGLLSNFFFFIVLHEYNRRLIADLPDIIRSFRPDVLVVDCITHSAAHVAEKLRIPWATNHPVPGLIPSRDAPPFTSWGLPPAQSLAMRAAYRMVRFGQGIFYRMFDPAFNSIRASQGLPPMRHCVVTSTLSPYLILIPTCEGFEYPRSDWPDQAHLIGPAPWGKGSSKEQSVAWIDELPRDRPVIYATLGTVQVFRSVRFFKTVISALRHEGYCVVMSIGPVLDPKELEPLPYGFRVERFVPHALILPRCTAVIHHGGQGIAQDCIYNGLPSVVVPISHDLYEIAARCEHAGVSLKIPYPRLTPERLRTCVKTILADQAIHAATRSLQATFRATNAGETGASLLEQLAATKKPVYRNTQRG